MLFQLAQRDHGTNGKAVIRLIDHVQPKAGQIDGGAHVDVFHLEPDHAAQHTVLPFLVQLPGFFQTFGPFVFSDRHHRCMFLSFYRFFYFITKSAIILSEILWT